MRRIKELIDRSKKTKEGNGFIVGDIAPIGMKQFTVADNSLCPLGFMSIEFLFNNKMDKEDVIYVDVLYQLTSQREFDIISSSPFNIDNWPDDFKEQQYVPIMADFNKDKNYFLSNLDFTKTGSNGEPELSDTAKSLLSGVVTPKPDPYYVFEASGYSESTETYTIRKVSLSKGQWLQISQFMYWIEMCMPIAPNIFDITSYRSARFIPVRSMIYDACTEVNFMGRDVIMAHFTLYFDNTINVGSNFGFNIPFELLENHVVSHYMDSKSFVDLYVNDDTVTPDRIFTIESPDKMSCLLTGLQQNQILVFTLDPETAKRLDWLSWEKYIYLENGKEITAP